MGHPSRRGFLGAVGGASLALLLGACAGEPRGQIDLGRLPELFGDRASVELIGRRAAAVRGVGGDPRAIERSLRPVDASGDWLRTTGLDDLRAIFDRKMRDDFERGRVVDVAGWRLSLTGARIAALMHLGGGGR